MERYLFALAMMLALTACKSEGPSASDLQAIYSMPVKIISCAKVSESVYRCRFAATNPQHPADEGEKTQCFSTDGSRWDIRLWC